jgi:hypothetical protein
MALAGLGKHELGQGTFRETGEAAKSVDPLGAEGSPAVGVERTFQRMCAISGVVCPLLFFGGLMLCRFLPPLRPGASAIEIAMHYQQHATGIRFGAALILLASMFYIAYSGAIYGQIRRIPGSSHTTGGVALAGGAVAAVTFMIPAMLWAVTAFRPDRSPETTQTLNDVAWFIVVMPWAIHGTELRVRLRDPHRCPTQAPVSALAWLPEHLGDNRLYPGDRVAVLQRRAVRVERFVRVLVACGGLRHTVRREHRLAAQSGAIPNPRGGRSLRPRHRLTTPHSRRRVEWLRTNVLDHV